MQSLRDLIESFNLYAVCESCQRQTKLNVQKLIKHWAQKPKYTKCVRNCAAGFAVRAPKIYALSMSGRKTKKPFSSTGAKEPLSG